MNKHLITATGVFALCLTGTAFGQTVTVGASGADFTSVKAAVDSFAPSGANNGNPADNVINIAPGTYVEGVLNLTENENYTIRGTDPTNRPILVVTPGAVSGGTAALGGFNMGGKALLVENLVLLPTYSAGDGVTPNTVSGEAIRMTNPTGVSGYFISVTVRNVLVSANNGSNQPASNGLTAATGHYTKFSGSGLRLGGGARNLNLERFVATHCNSHGVWDNGDIVDATDVRVVGPGCVFTYNGSGAEASGASSNSGYNQGAAGLTGMNGTAAEPITIANNNGHGWWINANPNPITGDVNYVYIYNNKASTDVNASGLHFVATTIPNGSRFYKCIFANNGSGTNAWANISAQNSQSPVFKFDECTIFNADTDQPAIRIVDNSGSGSWVFTNCIVAGTGDYLYSTEDAVTATFNNCAIVTAGPHAMNTAITAGANETVDATYAARRLTANTSAFTFNNVIHADPYFASVDPTNPKFLVVRNSVYQTAGTSGSALVGATSYENPPAGVKEWSIY